ncbi:MAG TPA: HEAT repeat domain-containing protein [Chthonomonadaceae bacterium]|nr:HEAT repeat domain-containing protein [Chthonomonadaceae bacterium]
MDNSAPDDVARLIEELKDDRRDVRSRAAYELGKHEDARALEPLAAALSDDDKFVRSWASGALAKAGPAAVPVLVDALGAADPLAAAYAALALGEIGDLRAVPLLARAVQEGDWDIKSRAAAALAAFGEAPEVADRALAQSGLTGLDRANILRSLQNVDYSDDERELHFRMLDVVAFCRGRSQSTDSAIREGAVDALQALETPSPEPAADRPGDRQPGPEPFTPEPMPWKPAPGDAAVEAAKQPSAEPTKPRRSLWERLTGR